MESSLVKSFGARSCEGIAIDSQGGRVKTCFTRMLWVVIGSVFIFGSLESIATETPKRRVKKPTYGEQLRSHLKMDLEQIARPVVESPVSEQELAKIIKKQKKRDVATVDDPSQYEKYMSNEFRALRDKFISIKTPDQLDEFLVDLDKGFNSIPSNAQDKRFIAAQMIPLRVFRGIFWRLAPTMADSRIAHSMIVTYLKNIAINGKIFFPVDSWKVGFEYVTQPFVENGYPPFDRKGMVVQAFPSSRPANSLGEERSSVDGRVSPDLAVSQAAKRSSAEAAVQAYFIDTLIPALDTAAVRLEKQVRLTGQHYFDNKLWYSPGDFPTNRDRFAIIGEVERTAAISSLYTALSEAAYNAAYTWEHSIALSRELGKLYGFDAFFSQVDGVPSKDRVSKMREFSDRGWGHLLRVPDDRGKGALGEILVRKSWEYLKKSVEYGKHAYREQNARKPDRMNLWDNSSTITFYDIVENRFENIEKMISGPTKMSSYIFNTQASREQDPNNQDPNWVEVNLPAFFSNPPSRLIDLYPKSFDDSPEFFTDKTTVFEGKTVVLPKHRNYLWKMGSAWNLDEYRKLFPNIKTQEDVRRSARVLSQAWGGSFIAGPMQGYIY